MWRQETVEPHHRPPPFYRAGVCVSCVCVCVCLCLNLCLFVCLSACAFLLSASLILMRIIRAHALSYTHTGAACRQNRGTGAGHHCRNRYFGHYNCTYSFYSASILLWLLTVTSTIASLLILQRLPPLSWNTLVKIADGAVRRHFGHECVCVLLYVLGCSRMFVGRMIFQWVANTCAIVI